MPTKPILLVQTGHPIKEILEPYGDYESWFRNATGLLDPSSLEVVYVCDGEQLPTASTVEQKYSGVVITGSIAMVSDKLPWSVASGEILKELATSGKTPILGVCYGHQLLADCLGGSVDYNPKGRSLGTKKISLLKEQTSEDDLFRIFKDDDCIYGHVSHMQCVLNPPPNATRLGWTDLDSNHVLRFGPRAWGTQFHPEFDVEITKAHITKRMHLLMNESPDFVPQALQSIRESDAGCKLFNQFLEICTACEVQTSIS